MESNRKPGKKFILDLGFVGAKPKLSSKFSSRDRDKEEPMVILDEINTDLEEDFENLRDIQTLSSIPRLQ